MNYVGEHVSESATIATGLKDYITGLLPSLWTCEGLYYTGIVLVFNKYLN